MAIAWAEINPRPDVLQDLMSQVSARGTVKGTAVLGERETGRRDAGRDRVGRV